MPLISDLDTDGERDVMEDFRRAISPEKVATALRSVDCAA